MEQLIIGLLVVIGVVSITTLAIALGIKNQSKNNITWDLFDSTKEQLKGVEQQLTALMARQDVLNSRVSDDFMRMSKQLAENAMLNEQKLDNMRRTIGESIGKMQDDNGKQLERIRITVDEKLQSTLDKKLSESFKQVSERLEQVYKGLGEMQTVASSVGDLKKVLSNVKTRGVLGEVQLGAILEQILNNEQYGRNVATKPHSQANVEYAVKLPGEGDTPVWLPIDAKFPADAYSNLVDAYEVGNTVEIEAATKVLKDRIKSFAKDIRDKYISPPETTDFAIMFLPFEGLYAEVVRLGLLETLQNDYKVNIAGPTTMAALLNSLQMGFKTLAITKRSSEVWDILGSVKNEFDGFSKVLLSAQKRINQANEDLDKLVGVRTRQIQRALRSVQGATALADDFDIIEDSDV